MFTDPARGTVYRQRTQRSNRELIDMIRKDLGPATLGLMQRNVRFDTLWSVMRGKSSSRLMRAGERETSHSLFPQKLPGTSSKRRRGFRWKYPERIWNSKTACARRLQTVPVKSDGEWTAGSTILNDDSQEHRPLTAMWRSADGSVAPALGLEKPQGLAWGLPRQLMPSSSQRRSQQPGNGVQQRCRTPWSTLSWDQQASVNQGSMSSRNFCFIRSDLSWWQMQVKTPTKSLGRDHWNQCEYQLKL